MRRTILILFVSAIGVYSLLSSASANAVEKYRVSDCSVNGGIRYERLEEIPGKKTVLAFEDQVTSPAMTLALKQAGIKVLQVWPGADWTSVCVFYATERNAKTTKEQVELLKQGKSWVKIHRYPPRALTTYYLSGK